MKKKLLSILLITFILTSYALAFTDVKIIEDKVISAYDAQIYIVSYKVKNTGSVTSQNIIVNCQILDGYGNILYTQKDFLGPLAAGQEHSGEFSYFRPDTSFLISHRLTIEIK